MCAPRQPPKVFRLPRTAYLFAVLLLFGAAPIAFSASGDEGGPAAVGLPTLILLVPIAAAVVIARTATIVSQTGIVVRAAFGRRPLPWSRVRGLSVTGNSVYAVLADGTVRLPCVRVANLAELARASGGRLPNIADPVPKQPPTPRRGRRR